MRCINAPHIVVVTGELSGDMIASNIVQSIKNRFPKAEISGSLGPSLRALGYCEEWVAMESFQAMGLWHVIQKLPSILKAERTLLKK